MICKHCNYEFDLIAQCPCKCGKCEEGGGFQLRVGKLGQIPAPKTTPAKGDYRPTCEGKTSGLGAIKIRTGSMSEDGYCNFCDHGQQDGSDSEIIRTVHVIEGGRAKFVLCVNCFALIRDQWNSQVFHPKERLME